MAKLVSNVYGDALFELAVEEGRVDQLLSEVTGVVETLEKNPEFYQMMDHPKINKEEKLQIIEEIFKGRISDELVGLLRMLTEKGHSKDINDVLEYFTLRIYEYQNKGIAYVTSAVELTEEQKDKVKNRLLETTSYNSFDINYKVDSQLIGGMVIRIGDRVVDSSIKTKITKLTRELSNIQLKVGECAP